MSRTFLKTRPAIRHILRDTRAASILEYGILAGLVSVAALSIAASMGTQISTLFEDAGASISSPIDVSESGDTETSTPPAGQDTTEDQLPPLLTCEGPDNRIFSFSSLRTELTSNIWNGAANGTARGDKVVCVSPNGSNSLPTEANPWTLEWELSGSGAEVVAYPEIVFGQKPWSNSGSSDNVGGIQDRDITLEYAYNTIGRDSKNNVSASIWLTDIPQARSSAITDEIMIWVDNSGMTPAGVLLGSDIPVGGGRYDLWHRANMSDTSGANSNTWNYWTFVSRSPSTSGSLDIDGFLDFLVSANRVPTDRYLSSVEFGAEVMRGRGEMQITHAAVSGLEAVEIQPQISAFTFGARTLSWDERPGRVWAPYVDIPGLDGTATDFVLTESLGGGNPLAESNVVGGPAATGQVRYGTNLSVDPPAPGETNIITLTVGGRSGTFTLSRDDIPDAGPFALTSNNGQNFAQINFDANTLPRTPYAFTVSGTGSTNPQVSSPSSGSGTQGMTPSWGVNISNQTPPRGITETITLVIDGYVVSWEVTGP
jgi:Flp pilus assembly pilin Flp